jgi:hypothetical protein
MSTLHSGRGVKGRRVQGPRGCGRVAAWLETQADREVPEFVSLVAILAAVVATAVGDSLCEVVRASRDSVVPDAWRGWWGRCWRFPRVAAASVLDGSELPHLLKSLGVPSDLPPSRILKMLTIGCREWRQLDPAERRQLASEVAEQWNGLAARLRFSPAQLRDIFKSLLADGPAAPWETDQFAVSCAFVLRVYLPAVLVYGCSPAKLYRDAVQGKFEALRSLLTLDPSAASLPEIQQRIQALMLDHKFDQVKMLNRAMRKDHSLNITPKAIKYALGAGVMEFSAMMADCQRGVWNRLRSVDIVNLYDALAVELSNGACQRDEGLDGAEAARKQLNRWKKKSPLRAWDTF